MSRLFLQCALCGRKQADGLLSRGYWGEFDGGNGTSLRVCPTCKATHADWQDRLRVRLADGAIRTPKPRLGGGLRAR